MRIRHRLLPSVLCLLSFGACAGEIYKWIDDNGNVNYGDRPHSDTAQTVKVRPHSFGEENAQGRRTLQRRLLGAFEQERAQKREAQEQAKQERRKHERQCQLAQTELMNYQRGGVFYAVDEDGNRIYLSDTEVADRITHLEEAVDQIC